MSTQVCHQTLFRCECESRLAGRWGVRKPCVCGAVGGSGGGGWGHPAQLYRLYTPANPTRRACGCRGTMLAIAWADARSRVPAPVFARRGGRAVVDTSDLDVHFKNKSVTRLVCSCAARAASRATCGPGAEAVACGSRCSADRGGCGCWTEMQSAKDLLD